MTDIKPYLKYCIGRIVTIKSNDERIIKTGNLSYLGLHLYANEFEYTIIPHLRKIESLTEMEAIHMIELADEGSEIVILSTGTEGILYEARSLGRYYNETLMFNSLSPAQFHYLTTIGIAWWATPEMWEKGMIIEVK
jgi:hypothetical protein